MISFMGSIAGVGTDRSGRSHGMAYLCFTFPQSMQAVALHTCYKARRLGDS